MKLSNDLDRPDWTENLPAERARIVRLCLRLTGAGPDAAEDLAQETLYEAWRLAGNLREPAAWRGFVSGIARNVCWRYLSRRIRDEARTMRSVGGASVGETAGEGSSAWERFVEAAGGTEPFAIEQALEREERADLLDRALGALPAATRQLLVEKYVEELPQAEIARRCRITENAVGVRIHRARAALRRVVESTPTLRNHAAAYGLVTTSDGGEANCGSWQQTRIWCPRCGQQRLEGRFASGVAAESESIERPRFAVRCPGCRNNLGFDFTTGHVALDSQRLLDGLIGYKPALNRLSAWWSDYFDGTRAHRVAACPGCGNQARTLVNPPAGTPPWMCAMRGLYFHCEGCERTCCASASGIVFHRAEAQAFWRRHPKMAVAPERDVVFAGRPAVVVTLESLTDSARFEAVLDRDDFTQLHATT